MFRIPLVGGWGLGGCEKGGCMEVKGEDVGERVKKQACERGHTLGKLFLHRKCGAEGCWAARGR